MKVWPLYLLAQVKEGGVAFVRVSSKRGVANVPFSNEGSVVSVPFTVNVLSLFVPVEEVWLLCLFQWRRRGLSTS